jgi:hypothetical protein
MKLKFVSDEEIKRLTPGVRLGYDWATFIEELYKHPNQWAEFPERIKSANTGYAVRNNYKDIEVKVTGGNGLSINDPEKKLWTVYLRYTPGEDDTF